MLMNKINSTRKSFVKRITLKIIMISGYDKSFRFLNSPPRLTSPYQALLVRFAILLIVRQQMFLVRIVTFRARVTCGRTTTPAAINSQI